MITKKTPIKIKHEYKDTEGRWLILQTSISEQSINLINIYAPNTDSSKFFADICERIVSLDNNHIIGGDSNLVLNIENDKKGGQPTTHKKSLEVLNRYIELEGLSDIWRLQNPESKVYTWGMATKAAVYSRLDFFLVSNQILKQIPSSGISPAYISDHAIPFLIFQIGNERRGPGFWKFNVSLLENSDYIEQVQMIIKTELEKNYDSNVFKWEMIKLEVRGFTVKYSARKKKSCENLIQVLEHKLKWLESELVAEDIHGTKIFSHESVLQELEKVKSDLNDILEYQAQGARIRTRTNWLNYGEKNCAYFFNLEKYNYISRNCFKLRDEKGNIVTNPKQILDIQARFYEQLYKSDKVEIDENYLSDLEFNKLSDQQQQEIDKEITSIEIHQAIKQLKKGKCPGNDGINIEWYECFYEQLKPFLLTLFREISRYGLPDTSKRGIVSLLEKVNRDQLEIKNWRPLSLLNCDGKIYAKILANRMYTVINDIVSKDQYGFIRNRYIGENLLELISTIDYCRKNKLDTLAISLDLEKAFDKVEWNVLLKILEFFNFGPNFRHMVKMLFQDTTSCTINNGYTSYYFQLERALRQGCPFSPAFLLLAEILGQKIKQNKNIKGIQIPNGNTKKTAQYADDLWAVIIDEERSANALISTINDFAANTGLRANYDKTQIMRISSCNANARYYSLRQLIWSDHINVLGIDVYNNPDNNVRNYLTLVEKIANIYNNWSVRTLTPIGKILVVNTLAISQMIYKLFVVVSPHEPLFKRLKEMTRNFIWDGKQPLIAYDKLTQDIKNGGLRLTDLKTRDIAIKTTWVGKSIQHCIEEPTDWMALANTFMPLDIPDMWEANLKPSDINRLNIGSSIWKSILLAWAKINYHNPSTETDILNEMLCYNSHITIQSAVIDGGRLRKAGIKYLRDIVDMQHRQFLSFKQLQWEFGTDIGTFLEYNALIIAIPQAWVSKVKMLQTPDTETEQNISLLSTIENKPSTSRYIYELLISRMNVSDGGRLVWSNQFNIIIDIDDWHKIRQNSYYATNYPKLRYFQVRLLSGKLITKVKRAKWDKTLDPRCPLCEVAETVLHILWECRKAHKLWRNLEKWSNYMMKIKLVISCQELIFNNYKGSQRQMVNTLTLIGKQYLYACTCMKEEPRFSVYLSKVTSVYYAEKQLAYQSGKIRKHERKWKPLQRALDH